MAVHSRQGAQPFPTSCHRLGACCADVLCVFVCSILNPLSKFRPEIRWFGCRCGSASHLGVECTTPTVGVGKTLLQMEGLNERHVRETISKALQAVHENHALPSGCYTQQTPRGETVACMELLSEGSGEVLGVAVGGMNASQRPIYISRGAYAHKS